MFSSYQDRPLDDSLPADDYFKARANGILNGDIDTYYEVINDVNPLDDLIAYGSEFECGTDDPRMIAVHFHVNSGKVLGEAKKLPKAEYNDLKARDPLGWVGRVNNIRAGVKEQIIQEICQ